MIIREILVEPQSVAWLPWAVSYFFFIGLAFSAVFIAFFLRFSTKNVRYELIAVSLALSCAIVAPIALTADLHQPSRIANFYLNPTAWSWMAWGALFLPLFSIAVVGYFIVLLRTTFSEESMPKMLRWLYWGNVKLNHWRVFFRGFSLVMALLILLYTTMEVFVVQARPLWHQPWLVALILFSVLPAVLLSCHAFMPQVKRLIQFCWLSLVGLVITVLGIYFFSVQTALGMTKLWSLSELPMLLCICFAGLVFLLLLPHSTLVKALRVFTALVLAWLTRWILLIQVQQVAKYNVMTTPYHLAWEVDGLIGILAVFSLWLFVGMVLWQLLPSRLWQGHLAGGKDE